MGIPKGITREHVLSALAALDTGESHGFGKHNCRLHLSSNIGTPLASNGTPTALAGESGIRPFDCLVSTSRPGERKAHRQPREVTALASPCPTCP